MQSPFQDSSWQPPHSWLRITSLEMHTGGHPLRVITSGLPPIDGGNVLEKRRFFREHYDHLRTGLIWEPRGHADMYAAVVTASKDADFDVFFLHNEGYSTMCGHAMIALGTLAVETKAVDRTGDRVPMSINVPAGRIEIEALVSGGRVQQVSFRNVPSFAYLLDQVIEVPGLGAVRFDVAYGGAFYAIVEAAPLSLSISAEQLPLLIDYGRKIKNAVAALFRIEHPLEDDLSFLYGTIFTGPASEPTHHSRNVCVFADGEVDRSPTGSGVSARAALHHARGELALNESIIIESITGSTMTVRALESTKFGPHEAIVAEVSGSAYITGRNEFYFDPSDPFARGFLLR